MTHDRYSLSQVHKQGIALGRSVDLSKFNGYDELVAELDRLFDFNGELKAPGKNWLIVYTDDEGDMMLVGDDPWQYVVLLPSHYSIEVHFPPLNITLQCWECS